MQNFDSNTPNTKKITSVMYIGAGYVGTLSAITMAVSNPKVSFTVFDINKELIEKWGSALE